jgi:hypothetical protein
MSLKIIDRNIRTITTNVKKLNELIHTTAVLIMAHAEQHGDCTRALTLVKAMPASFRRSMLIKWFEEYSPIRVSVTNDRVGILPKTAKNYRDFDVKAGTETPFYEIAERNPEKEYDFDALVKMVESLATTINRRVDNGKVPEADAASAKAMVAKLSSLKFSRVKPANTNEAPLQEKAVG